MNATDLREKLAEVPAEWVLACRPIPAEERPASLIADLPPLEFPAKAWGGSVGAS